MEAKRWREVEGDQRQGVDGDFKDAQHMEGANFEHGLPATLPQPDQEPEIRQVYSHPPDNLQLSQIPLIAKRCGEAGGNYRFRLREGHTLSNYDESFSLDCRG